MTLTVANVTCGGGRKVWVCAMCQHEQHYLQCLTAHYHHGLPCCLLWTCVVYKQHERRAPAFLPTTCPLPTSLPTSRLLAHTPVTSAFGFFSGKMFRGHGKGISACPWGSGNGHTRRLADTAALHRIRTHTHAHRALRHLPDRRDHSICLPASFACHTLRLHHFYCAGRRCPARRFLSGSSHSMRTRLISATAFSVPYMTPAIVLTATLLSTQLPLTCLLDLFSCAASTSLLNSCLLNSSTIPGQAVCQKPIFLLLVGREVFAILYAQMCCDTGAWPHGLCIAAPPTVLGIYSTPAMSCPPDDVEGSYSGDR